MSIELKRMTPSRAAYVMERFKREEKLLGPNEQAALTYVIDMLEKATAIQQAEAQQPATGEQVYQICKKDSHCISSAWIDVEKRAYEDAGMYPEYGRRTLYTHPAPSVPEGYALVPIEPTDEMMSEMLGPFIAINGDNRSAFIEAYPRMLTAAKKETP